MANNYTLFSVELVTDSTEESEWINDQLRGEFRGCQWKWTSDLDEVAEFLREWLAEWHPTEQVSFSWAETCSKPRPNAFGGGACFISSDLIQWLTTNQWLNSMERKAS
jgi:hypothetical protein